MLRSAQISPGLTSQTLEDGGRRAGAGQRLISSQVHVLAYLSPSRAFSQVLSFSVSFTATKFSRRSPWGAEVAAASVVLGNPIYRGQGFWEGPPAPAAEQCGESRGQEALGVQELGHLSGQKLRWTLTDSVTELSVGDVAPCLGVSHPGASSCFVPITVDSL